VRKYVTNVVLGVQVAAFAMVCIVCSPAILFKFGVDWVQERIETRWPGSEHARAVRFWIGLLAPALLCLVLLIVVIVLASGVGELSAHRPH
jgi:TRAP-type C4-dicarboxylate transport system permease small subunit